MTKLDSSPGKGKRFVCSPKRPVRLWGPATSYLRRTGVLFRRKYCRGLSWSFASYLLSRLRMNGAVGLLLLLAIILCTGTALPFYLYLYNLSAMVVIVWIWLKWHKVNESIWVLSRILRMMFVVLTVVFLLLISYQTALRQCRNVSRPAPGLLQLNRMLDAGFTRTSFYNKITLAYIAYFSKSYYSLKFRILHYLFFVVADLE